MAREESSLKAKVLLFRANKLYWNFKFEIRVSSEVHSQRIFSYSVYFTEILSVTYLRHTGSVSVCRSSACLAAASQVVGARNTSFSPCDHMWSYSCGGWISNNPVPQSRYVAE